MESKVKEYQELYGEFEALYERISKVEEPIREIEREIEQIQSRQKKVDYNNPDVVIGYMETYIDDSIAKKKEIIKNEVNDRIADITNPSGRAKKNFDKAVKWLSMAKVDKYLRSADIDFAQEIWVEKAEKATEFTIATVLNTIFSFVFRFDFLRFLPKAVRIIAGVIFWAIILIPKILAKVYNQFKPIYDSEFSSLSADAYDMAAEQFAKKFFVSCASAVVIVFVLIVVINVVAYFAAKYTAKKYLSDNKVVCLSFIDPIGLKKKMYDHDVSTYMENTVANWKEEITSIKTNGLGYDFADSNSLIGSVRSDLHEKYIVLENKIDDCKARIVGIQRQSEQLNADLQIIIPKLKGKETEVDSLVGDSNHNNAVLSPYVSAGYSQHIIEGVKELVYFKHSYKPMLICYGDNTVKDGERFRKNAARLIELFMQGFFQENYHAYINMWLVDFEGLYFPESRTKGLMKVVRAQQGVQQLFEELKNTRETVDSLADGKIGNINPIRLLNRENPIKYNVVYFIGYDFTAVEREISQLFISGENFGFLPIVFMKKSLAQSLLKDDGSSKAFSRVVEKMKDNSQIYEFEGLVSEFEYGLMVSNQKSLLDEKLCVNKILSMDEFVEATLCEGGFDFDKVLYPYKALYLDTYQLEEWLYETIFADEDYSSYGDMNYVKLFTINGEIPKFVTKEVIKL